MKPSLPVRAYAALIGLAFICDSTEAQQPRSRKQSQTRQNYSDSYRKYIKTLSKVDKIELLAITSIPEEEIGKVDCKDPKFICVPPYGVSVRVLTSITLRKADAEKVALLWRKLEPGNGAGCYAPAYIIRYFFEEKLILETAVCFHCCNASLPNYKLAGICGDGKATEEFKEVVMAMLPYPEMEKK